MKNIDTYLLIIKKQQELIDLMIETGICNDDMPKTELKTICNNSYQKKEGINDIEGFKKWLNKKGMSQNCIDTYSTHIKLFFQEYEKMNIENLSKYEKAINDKFSPKTINLKACAMSKYFKYTGFAGYEFKRAKEQKRTFCDNVINLEQYNKLLEWAKENNRKVWLIVKTIGNTGVRVSELIELKTKDLDKGYADIVGKGNKQRRIYFPSSFIADIKAFCGNEYIIENKYGEKMTTRGVASVINKAAKKAEIPKEVMHPHSFRHFFAKQFLNEKNDITLLGDLLGHSDISTTAIYTRLTAEEQKSEINKLVNW